MGEIRVCNYFFVFFTTHSFTYHLSRDEPDVKLGSQVAVASQHRFSERTLQIFLKEMRLALKDDNHNEVSNYFELPPSDPFGAIDRKLI